MRRRPFLPPAMPCAMLIVTLATTLLPGCSPGYSPDTYSSAAVQQAAKVEQGTVAGVRRVGVQASGTTGALAGAAAGGAVGASTPTAGVGNALTTLGGSLVGGLVGTGIERATGDTFAFEYIVRKSNGELISVTQKDAEPLVLGQKVLVIAGAQARIVPDYTVPPDPLEEKKPEEKKPEERKPEAAKPEPTKPPEPSFTTIQ